MQIDAPTARQPALRPGDRRSSATTALRRATITGKPASSSSSATDNLGTAKGHADQIVYDVNEGTVLLTKDAWLSDGRNEMSGAVDLVRHPRAEGAGNLPGGEPGCAHHHHPAGPAEAGRTAGGQGQRARRMPRALRRDDSQRERPREELQVAPGRPQSRSRSRTAKSSVCSAPTAPARRPRST